MHVWFLDDLAMGYGAKRKPRGLFFLQPRGFFGYPFLTDSLLSGNPVVFETVLLIMVFGRASLVVLGCCRIFLGVGLSLLGL